MKNIPDTLFKPITIISGIVLLALGVILYLASYFYGLLLILGAVGIYALYRGKTQGKEALIEDIHKALKNLAVPVLGMLIALIIGAIIMLLTNLDPIAAYRELFYGAFVKNWHISILNAAPLIFTGLSIAFAFKAGLFNIGAEGQYYVGALVAAFLGINLRLPALGFAIGSFTVNFSAMISITLIFLISAAVASLYNVFPAFLKVKTGAHEVITTMMFAQIARYLSPIFIRLLSSDPNKKYVTDTVYEHNELLHFKSFLPDAYSRLHIGILIGIATALFVYYILYHTKYGYEIRAVGQNPHAAKVQGISVAKNIYIALLFAGFLAGMSGVNQVVGLDHHLAQNLNAGYGWNGISVALLASNHPIGVVFTAILWGALDSGGQFMARRLQVSNAIVEIIKGIILFLVVAKYLFPMVKEKIAALKTKKAKENAIS